MINDDFESLSEGLDVDAPAITGTIRKALQKVGRRVGSDEAALPLETILEQLKKKQKEKIIRAALLKYQQSVELKPYQAELIKLQKHIERLGIKMIVLFDGRDASGKGGTIRRVTRYMNEKRYRVIVLGKPSSRQRTELHMKRYIEHFPYAGEMALFDRSWYNRAMVEPVMGFCSKKQYNDFLRMVNSYEHNFVSDGKTVLLKLYYSVSKEEQSRRFERRQNDPLRQWKLSEVDLQAQELWDEFTTKKYRFLQRTHTAECPWYIIRSDDKHQARMETMKVILNSVRYRGRRRNLDFSLNKDVVRSGDQEMAAMRRQRRKYGKFVR